MILTNTNYNKIFVRLQNMHKYVLKLPFPIIKAILVKKEKELSNKSLFWKRKQIVIETQIYCFHKCNVKKTVVVCYTIFD